jgi:hypothetical protein
MRNLILAAIVFSALQSCSKNHTQSIPPLPSGEYSGTFKRYHTTEDKTADIQLVFKKGNWEGSSSINKYPALIKGNYSIAENAVIKFVETSPWTAEFDWTLILHGSYLLHRNDDSLIFTRSYANGYVDVFKLAKSK